jgi:hypothetical protein
MRLLSIVTLTVALAGCAAHHTPTPEATLDASASPLAPDAYVSPDAGTPVDSGPVCTCRTGTFQVTGGGDGYMVDYELGVRECDGALACTIDGETRTCMRTDAFRVHLDTAGYTQLIFSRTPCNDAWPGRYATYGGGVEVRATRIE